MTEWLVLLGIGWVMALVVFVLLRAVATRNVRQVTNRGPRPPMGRNA